MPVQLLIPDADEAELEMPTGPITLRNVAILVINPNIEGATSHLGEHGLVAAIARVKIPVVNGEHKAVPSPELSAPQINAATRALLAKKSPTPKNPARHALEGVLGKHDALSHVVVHEREGFATFTNVPLASLGVFARALTSVKLPAIPKPAKKRTKK